MNTGLPHTYPHVHGTTHNPTKSKTRQPGVVAYTHETDGKGLLQIRD